MLRVSDLNNVRTKATYNLLKKSFVIQEYLYLGNKFEYNGNTYKMDGDLNLYLIGYNEDGSESDLMPIFVNETAHQLFLDMAESIDDNRYVEMKILISSTMALNK